MAAGCRAVSLLVGVRQRRIVGGRSGRGARRSALGGARRLFLRRRRREAGGFDGRRRAGGFLLCRRVGLCGQPLRRFLPPNGPPEGGRGGAPGALSPPPFPPSPFFFPV